MLRNVCSVLGSITLIGGFLAGTFIAAASQVQPAERSRAVTTSRPVDSVPRTSGDPAVDALLDRLEVKGNAIKGLSAEIVYTHITTEPVVDRQKKIGRLLFARGEPNDRFLVHFTKLLADGVVTNTAEYYAFDGQWYVERNDAGKNVLRRELGRRGERIDAFELGKGPFPLPFGQKRSDILWHFEVSIAADTRSLPKGLTHLICTPRGHSSLAEEYSRVEMWVDSRLDLPVRIATERSVDKVRVEVEFNQIDLKDAPAGSRFTVETPKGFFETVEPFDDRPQIDVTPRGKLPGGGRP